MKKLIVVFIVLSSICSKAQNLDELIKFIKDNPEKASISLIENGKNTINYQSTQLMPLASAAKTIIAIEFAKQAAEGKIDPYAKVSVSEIAKYYIPNTDGGAHPKWLQSLQVSKEKINLLDVAMGMIKFSSNANTEFLEDYLGLNAINQTLKTLGLNNHQAIYYFTASAVMACLKPKSLSDQQWIDQLKAMPMDKYRKRCAAIHQKMKKDSLLIKTFDFNNLSTVVQKVWSDRLVASTTQDYANLMWQINNGKYLSKAGQTILETILEWPMGYPGNQQRFKHLGQKGGSTSFVLTDAFYVNEKDGNLISCAFFFNNLSPTEAAMVNGNFGAFEASIITNKMFREKLAVALK